MQLTVKWPDGFITVRSGTVQDDINAQIIENALITGYGPGAQGFYGQFGRLCAQTVVSAGIGFVPEAMAGADTYTRKMAYESWCALPLGVRNAWQNAVTRANVVAGLTTEEAESQTAPNSEASTP